MGRDWQQGPLCWSLFPRVEDHGAGDCRWKACLQWALRAWCTGAYEMFLTSVLGTKRAKGKKKSEERRWCFPVQSWELRDARLGNMASGRDVHSWILLP